MKKRIFAVIFIIVALAAGFYFSREAAGETKKKQYLFGATYMTMNNPYFPALNESIKEVIEGNGDILITRNPLQDQDKQNEQIADMIEEGIDLLFLNPVNLRGVKPAIKLCQENDIPIIVVDTNTKGKGALIYHMNVVSCGLPAAFCACRHKWKRRSLALCLEV
ncbi:ABC-type sugar transport system substrate-binding protein [Lachnospiraceae bacterium PF1-21]|uniref:Substrate-binding domain-containing protein n=1 Tax=Ohessyouella blattaphilus TaxID=2949333 RepID=A0ABT1EKT8_9FIRM|nr:substrate-binding domain-containing protein [Ohessyouella blattaphilus]MCP1111323.1 substrate-binding domain-containing protein [Ohessyouella blattaphilus]MCR8564717.1 substrate-binding domain-containing protein [Ohessyouella blattaphilus]MDL2250267.1 substrate-binding domain-containing protein [Lachnospiraceae bacterium OttesenSCG-928-J05]